MKKTIVLITALLLAGAVSAFMSSADTGTSGAAVLKLPAGAKASAMGEAFTSVSDDSTAAFWNPAGLNRLTRSSFTFMHAVWFEDIAYEWASVAVPLGAGRLGLGVKYLSYGSINETDLTGYQTGTFNPSDMVISGSYAGNLSGVYWGITLKYVSLKIKASASAFCGDLGLIQPFKLADMRAVGGFGIYNLGFGGKFVDETFSLPLAIKAGLSVYLQKNLLAAADVVAPSDGTLYFAFGAEYREKLDGEMSLAVRAGYNSRNSGAGGLTAGAGLIFGDLSIDYAFVPFGNLGDTHRFSLTLAFGAVQVPVKQAAEKQEPAAPAETKGAEDKIPQK